MNTPFFNIIVYHTVGCHLCEQADDILLLLSKVYPVMITKIDIADLPEQNMWSLATSIPVIEFKKTQLKWPFGLLDVAQLILN